MKNLILAAALCTGVASAQQPPLAVTQDPAPAENRQLAPRMIELHFPASDKSQLNGIFYLAGGAAQHPTVILLHGFPGNEQNLDLAQSIRRAGWNVLYFHYRGAWGSQGDFSFSNAIADTLAAVGFVHDPEVVKKYGIDPSRVVLVGHSMGGFMAGFNGAYAQQITSRAKPGASLASLPLSVKSALPVQGVALISPWDLGRDLATDKDAPAKLRAAELEEFRGYELALHGFKAEAGIAEIRKNSEQWQLEKIIEQIAKRNIPLLLTFGEFEDGGPAEFERLSSVARKAGAKHFSGAKLPTDHAYSDQRIALQATIVRWLGQFQ